MKTFPGSISKRIGRIWLFVLLLVTSSALLTVAVLWAEAARDTDLTDPTGGLTARSIETRTTNSPIRFRDVSGPMGLTMRHGPGPRTRCLPEDTGSGLAWNDYDNDGDWDLYVVNFPHPSDPTGKFDGANSLFRNDGDRFTDVGLISGTADPGGFGMGASFADYDDDGDTDLYVTNFGPNRLFRNRGDGTFEEVGVEAGVADPLWSTGAAWGDFDRDGHLDLYVCNYVQYDVAEAELQTEPDTSAFGRYEVPYTLNPNSFDPVPNRLYRNRGDGTFEDVAVRYGVQNAEGRSFAATFCDLDGDGWLDLYVANDVSENKLFRNTVGDGLIEEAADRTARSKTELSRILSRQTNGSPGAFADLSFVTGTGDPRGSMGLSVGEIGTLDAQADSLPDLFITHWIAQENAIYQSLVSPDGLVEYRDKTRQFGLGEVSIDNVGWGCGFADIDLDGRIDLLVANGSTLEHSKDVSRLIEEPLRVFWNDGARFHDVATAPTVLSQNCFSARGLAIADYDKDGDADFAISINRGEPRLFRNETSSLGKSLKVRLNGSGSACFGAKVEVAVGDELLIQWYGADVSFLSMHAPELIFGLGKAEVVDRVRIVWADGTESVLGRTSPGTVEMVAPGRCH